MVVSCEVLAFYHLVAVEFHLFARDTGLIRHAFSHRTVAEGECLHLFEGLAASCNGSIHDFVGQSHEVSVLSHEVGFALEGEDGTEVTIDLHEYATFCSLAIGALSGNGLTALADEFYCGVEIAFCFCESVFAVAETCAGEGAKLFDVFNIYSHGADMGVVGSGRSLS